MRNLSFWKRTLLIFLFSFTIFGLMACGQVEQTTKDITDLPIATNIENFNNYEELKAYLSTIYDETEQGYLFKNAGSVSIMTADASYANESTDTTAQVDRTHSESNFQVEGVAEDDTVLTDGYHIYICNWENFFIINADTLAIEYTYQMDNGYLSGMFLEDGHIVLLAYQYTYTESKNSEDTYYWYHYSYGAKVIVFDVSEVSETVEPTISKELFFDNSYINDARMIDGYVYLSMNNYVINYGFAADEAYYPVYRDSYYGTEDINLPAQNIYVMPNDNYSINYMMLVSFSVSDDAPAVVNAYIGSSYQIYMSLFNLYTVTYRYTYDQSTGWYDYSTYVLRFGIDEDHSLVFQAIAQVSGCPLNQFSMDEYDGTFRIATTNYNYDSGSMQIENSLFVLDATSVDTMTKISELGGLGLPNERIYAVRFTNDIAYVITAFQSDPMYKIILTDPANPVLADELHEEGVNDYVHVISDTLLLGVGRASQTDGDRSWFTGVKVELYLTNEDGLTALDYYLAPGEYSYTNVSWDHKAFMSFTPEGEDFTYVAIPVYEYYNGYNACSQNVYVFKVNHSGSLELITTLSHMNEDIYNGSYWYWDSIERTVIIGNYIYTISNNKIQMFDMASDFAYMTKTELGSNYWNLVD
ncbi:MAG: beta-propeller domain-containing protein [Candidatus Izemoplasmatales bacterium]|nr:beta-propeller domain-containing protein [Candidatus Izemoplasmatales bacterium]